MLIDTGLLVVRVVVGGLVLAHGLQKLVGWFDGPGLDGWARMLEQMGYRSPRRMAPVHALAETGGGLLLALGLLTPLAAAAVVGVMVNAIVVAHGPNGPWMQEGGYEYPFALAAIAAGLSLAGPGTLALDATMPWALTPTWGIAGIVLGLVTGLGVLQFGRLTAAEADGEEHTSPGAPSTA